jgi:hypothetical protein
MVRCSRKYDVYDVVCVSELSCMYLYYNGEHEGYLKGGGRHEVRSSDCFLFSL